MWPVLVVVAYCASVSHGRPALMFQKRAKEERLLLQDSHLHTVKPRLPLSSARQRMNGLARLLISCNSTACFQAPNSIFCVPRPRFKKYWKRSRGLKANEDDEDELEKLDKAISKILFLAPLVFRIASSAWRFSTRALRLRPRVMVVRLSGVIMSQDELRLSSYYNDPRPGLLCPESAGDQQRRHTALFDLPIIDVEKCDRLLTRAFKARGVRAVAVLINSPGGSPAESSLIYQRLRALRKQNKNVPLLAFVKDYAASGGYYIACAADEIFADPSSLVGSIGVITQSFGYVQKLKREGMTRRVHTAGKQKGGVDPYLPERRRDIAMEKRLLSEIHSNFIAAVKEGRSNKLRPEEAAKLHASVARADGGVSGLVFGKPSKRQVAKLVKEGAGLFDGAVYSGAVGLKLGLVDQLGEMRTELQNRYGRRVHIDEVNGRPWLLRWLLA